MYPVPVIDLFAGPGGLGEGFSSIYENNKPCFQIVLSIENDLNAHATLELRSFFRKFQKDKVPKEYYGFLRQEISREALFKKYPDETVKAQSEARLATLGKTEEKQVDLWIHEALESNRNEWVLIGGPPCQAYSIAGRSRNKGIKGYNPANDEKHYLYREYLRIISKHWPSVFVMENVKGILSSQVNGRKVFENIINDLINPGRATKSEERFKYRIYSLVESSDSDMGISGKYVIKSEHYGVPQARHRVIVLGVRDSVEFKDLKPDILQLVDEKVTAWDVIADLPKIRSGLSSTSDGQSWTEAITDIAKTDWFQELPDEEGKIIDENLSILNEEARRIPEIGKLFMGGKITSQPKLSNWYMDKRLKGVCNHITRNQMKGDLHRYFYSACFAKLHGKSATLNDFPRKLLPAHKNVEESITSKNLFCDRFRVQMPDRPATTITSHIAKDGHYYIHPDPVQCRCLSVREAARIQTFPDNYFFCGSRTAQYTQVGNAVPPLLASKIALIVYSLLLKSRSNHA